MIHDMEILLIGSNAWFMFVNIDGDNVCMRLRRNHLSSILQIFIAKIRKENSTQNVKEK